MDINQLFDRAMELVQTNFFVLALLVLAVAIAAYFRPKMVLKIGGLILVLVIAYFIIMTIVDVTKVGVDTKKEAVGKHEERY